jgi:hypothetical protein
MNPLARQFANLKFSLQELESAVQQPREEPNSVERILYSFPNVISGIVQVLSEGLAHVGCEPASLQAIFEEAHQRGWLKGELGLWLHLIREYEQLDDMDPRSARGISLAQHIRACSSMLWQTYEMMTQRFQWQTQTVAISARKTAPGPTHYPTRAY